MQYTGHRSKTPMMADQGERMSAWYRIQCLTRGTICTLASCRIAIHSTIYVYFRSAIECHSVSSTLLRCIDLRIRVYFRSKWHTIRNGISEVIVASNVALHTVPIHYVWSLWPCAALAYQLYILMWETNFFRCRFYRSVQHLVAVNILKCMYKTLTSYNEVKS